MAPGRSSQQLMEAFDTAKLPDATVQTLHDRADNLVELRPLSLFLNRLPTARPCEARLHWRGRSAGTGSENTWPSIRTVTYTTVSKGSPCHSTSRLTLVPSATSQVSQGSQVLNFSGRCTGYQRIPYLKRKDVPDHVRTTGRCRYRCPKTQFWCTWRVSKTR